MGEYVPVVARAGGNSKRIGNDHFNSEIGAGIGIKRFGEKKDFNWN